MPFDDPYNQSGPPRLSGPGNGIFGKIVGTLAGAVMLIVAFTVSLLVFATVAAIALVIVVYLWWKTRTLRKQMREHPPGGRVIEGEVIERAETRDASGNRPR